MLDRLVDRLFNYMDHSGVKRVSCEHLSTITNDPQFPGKVIAMRARSTEDKTFQRVVTYFTGVTFKHNYIFSARISRLINTACK